MPRGRNRYERAVQLIRWAEAQWPVGRPIDIRFVDDIVDDDGNVDKDATGQTYRDGRRLVIELRRVRCYSCLLATAIHEFTHALMWGHSTVELRKVHHPAAFYTQQGEIEDRWHHDHGAEESAAYPVD